VVASRAAGGHGPIRRVEETVGLCGEFGQRLWLDEWGYPMHSHPRSGTTSFTRKACDASTTSRSLPRPARWSRCRAVPPVAGPQLGEAGDASHRRRPLAVGERL